MEESFTSPSRPSPRRRLRWSALSAIASAIAAAAVIVIVARRLPEREGEQAVSRRAEPLRGVPEVARSTSAFLNARVGVEYVGSAICRECHESEYASHAASHHNRSLSRMAPDSPSPDGVVDHAPSKRSYRIERRGGAIWHREAAVLDDGSRTEIAAYPVTYQIGSGHVARSYLVEDGGFLVQSPVSWYAGPGRWEMSPGYETPDQWSFNRTVRSGCLYCHAGRLEDAGRRGLRHQIRETAIGCERCHGPGQLHVARHSASSTVRDSEEFDRTIVHPGRLSRELGEDVCAQCHLQGIVSASVRGRQPEEFRPGLPLSEYRLEFRRPAVEDGLRVAGHVEQLHQSRCYQESATLTCSTCHRPHEAIPAAEARVRYRRICLDCHQPQACLAAPEARRASSNDDCVQCHMPRAATEVTHVALTDHRIGVSAPDSPRDAAASADTETELIPLQSLEHLPELDRARSVGLAQLALVRMSGKSPEQVPRLMAAREQLRRAFDGGIRDAETLSALASIARDARQLAIGLSLGEQALQSREITAKCRLETVDVLAELHFLSGRLDTAAELLAEAARDSRSAWRWHLLGQIEQRRGRRDAALSAARQAVALDPGSADYRRALITLLEDAGQEDEARGHREIEAVLTGAGTRDASAGHTD